MYDPTLARFVSADPLISRPDDTQSYNRYSYVSNRPMFYTDPSGFSGANSGCSGDPSMARCKTAAETEKTKDGLKEGQGKSGGADTSTEQAVNSVEQHKADAAEFVKDNPDAVNADGTGLTDAGKKKWAEEYGNAFVKNNYSNGAAIGSAFNQSLNTEKGGAPVTGSNSSGGAHRKISGDVNGDGASTDIAVRNELVVMVEAVVRSTGLSININSTVRGPCTNSAHCFASAVDINRINGLRVDNPSNVV